MSDTGIKVEFQGKELRKFLEDYGLSKVQMGATAVGVIERGMLDSEISTSATALAAIKKMNNNVQQTQQRVSNMDIDIRAMKSDCEQLHAMLDNAKTNARQDIINDPKSIDAVNVFTRVLQSAVDVLGDDKMTEAVCCKAIEAASYGAWRSIMGEK